MAPQQTYPPPPPYYPPPPPPPWTDWNNPKSMDGRHQEMTQTVTNTVTVSSAATTSPYPLADQGGSPLSSSSPSHSGDPHHQGNHNNNNNNNQHSLSSGVMAAAGVIATLVFIAALVGLCCFLCRKSRKSKKATRHPEELIVPGGMIKVPDTRAYIKPPAGSPPSFSSQSSSSIPLSRRPTSQAPPIILSTTMDHSYFTGIDTSDHISLADNQSTRSTDPEEPPPPYRPRSVPPISRECSVRIANGMLPNYMPGNSISSTEVLTHNPFEHPDDVVSDMEDETPENNTNTNIQDDHLSIVSDLSYQQEPTTTHSTI